MHCENCGKKIPKQRLKALPNITTCVKCSEEKPKVGVMVWHDHTPNLAILDKEEAERHKYLERTAQSLWQ